MREWELIIRRIFQEERAIIHERTGTDYTWKLSGGESQKP